jgi:hypothetical protein
MNNDSQKHLLLSVSASLIAQRDEIVFKISSVLNSEFNKSEDYVTYVSELFENLSKKEMTIDALQTYFKRHFTKIDGDDNNS